MMAMLRMFWFMALSTVLRVEKPNNLPVRSTLGKTEARGRVFGWCTSPAPRSH